MEKESTDYRHPSYGVICRGNQQGSRDNLFGTMVSGQSTVCIKISEAVVSHNTKHGTILVNGDKRILEIVMSPLQWAQFVSSGEETPCTLSWRDGKFVKESPEPITTLKLLHAEFEHSMHELGARAAALSAKAKELEEKPTVTKADRKAFAEIARNVSSSVNTSTPYLMSKFATAVERMLAEVKTNQPPPAPGS